jgi:5-(carboxyamino)imidazole ribonucleotide mutase
MNPVVGIIMGSQSDLEIMRLAQDALTEFNICAELTIVSAHRTPERLVTYAQTAVERGLKVIIAGAGGAAHLPGMVAAITPLPVVGVPIRSSNSIDGWDSLLSIVQMPTGVPVATVAINGAFNAGILAVQMLSTGDSLLIEKITLYKKALEEKVMDAIRSNQWVDPLDSLPQ